MEPAVAGVPGEEIRTYRSCAMELRKDYGLIAYRCAGRRFALRQEAVTFVMNRAASGPGGRKTG